MKTLAIDIGGSGIKALVLDAAGTMITERVRVDTPRPGTPAAVVAAIEELVRPLGSSDHLPGPFASAARPGEAGFGRVSVGFPGVVVDGVVMTGVNLHETWVDVPLQQILAERLGKPTRVINDAGMQGLGAIRGKGVEMIITLGTGMGCGVYLDGRYVPNLELAHHPFKKGMTYEDYVGEPARDLIGKKKWNKRVEKVIAQILPIWNPTRLYIGGGNAKHLKIELPPNVEVVENIAGLLGGVRLWDDR